MNYGIENGVIREPVQVMMHLPENWAKILFVRTYVRLRSIGCRFVVRARTGASEPPAAHLAPGRERLAEDIKIEELPESDKGLWLQSSN